MEAFWTGGFDFNTPVTGIDELLSQRTVSLEDVLSHVDVVPECKYLNSTLIEYLARKEVVESLVHFVITLPTDRKEDTEKPIWPYVASELFACEVTEILNVFFDHPELLTLLFSFLDAPAPLSPGDCAYFCKVVVVLITKKHTELLEWIQTSNVLDKVLNHIGVYSIMELLIRIGWDDGTGMNQYDDTDSTWLHQENLVGKLVSKLDPAYDVMPEVHTNAACALVDAVVKSSPLVPKTALFVADLQSQPVLDVLFSYMFSGNVSSLAHTLSVAIVLVQSCSEHRLPEAATEGERTEPEIIKHVLHDFPRLATILGDEKNCERKTQQGVIHTCGASRLKVVELVLALVRCAAEDETTDSIARRLVETNTLTAILQLFMKSPWNNLLHGLVEGIIHTILDIQEQEDPIESPSLLLLRKNLFASAGLLSRIIEAFKRNHEAMTSPKGCRLGFMGHLMRLTGALQSSFSGTMFMQLGVQEEEVKRWETFLTEVFSPEFHTQHIVLGGRHPALGPPQLQEDEAQDLDGLQLNSMEPSDQYRTTYETNPGEEDDDDDDDFFNWETRAQPVAAEATEAGNDSDDSDEATPQEVVPPPPPPPERGEIESI